MKPKKLDELNKENIFEVPDGYFEELPLQIQKRVEQERKSAFGGFSTATLRWGISSLAAIVLALLIWFQFPAENTSEQQDTTNPEFLSELSQEEVETFLLATDIHHTELVEAAQEGEALTTTDIISTQTVEEELLELHVDLIDVQTYL